MSTTLSPSVIFPAPRGGTPTAPVATPQAPRKRYAVVGAGARAEIFIEALAGQFRDRAELVGLCDIAPVRFEWHNAKLREMHDHAPVAGYHPDDFERMIVEQGVDVAIVTTIDALHHEYIIRAMNAGCDVIVEKPMTIDAEKARAIHETMQRTGRDLRVTFNVRYQPLTTKVRELIAGNAIGKPLAVNMNYTLDTRHGANYFRRWHRDKSNSGGLLIHKATHHFDQVNWLIGSVPEEVFAFGEIKFYGREAALTRGEKYNYERYSDSESSKQDPFAGRRTEYYQALYADAKVDSHHARDRNVFGSGVTTEDTLGVLARYENGVLLNYSIIAYAPQEGYELYITGTKGRIEVRVQNTPHVLNDELQVVGETEGTATLRLLPMFREPQLIEVPKAVGGHDGGDPIMLRQLFSQENLDDPLDRLATYRDGLASVGLGIAANESIATGQSIRVRDIIDLD